MSHSVELAEGSIDRCLFDTIVQISAEFAAAFLSRATESCVHFLVRSRSNTSGVSACLHFDLSGHVVFVLLRIERNWSREFAAGSLLFQVLLFVLCQRAAECRHRRLSLSDITVQHLATAKSVVAVLLVK